MLYITDRLRAATAEGILAESNQIEYIDRSGNTTTVKEALDELEGKIDMVLSSIDEEGMYAYGVQWDKTSTDPDCTRVGNMNLHRSLPIQNQMKGCLLDDDGNVVKYLPDSGWTEEILDGSMGQVMVEIPEFYWRFSESGNSQKVMLSEVPLVGYKKVEKSYVGAYEASVDTQDSSKLKLVSVNSDATRYRGGNNDASSDNTYKTCLRRPRTYMSMPDARTYARNRKTGGYNWNLMSYQQHKTVWWLFVVEYATRYSQKNVTTELDGNGCKMGGLGSGVTTVVEGVWNTFNNRYPFVPIGTTDSLGNGNGEVEYVSYSADNASWTTVMVPRYRGIENPFGNCYKALDGIKVEVCSGGTTGETKIYVCDNPTYWNSDSNTNNYTYVGKTLRDNGWVKEIFFGEDGDIFCTRGGGTEKTYFTDYCAANNFQTGVPQYRAFRVGGNGNLGEQPGFCNTHVRYGPTQLYSDYGHRLAYIPTW